VPFLNGGRGFSVRDHREAKIRQVGNDAYIDYTRVDDYPKYSVPFYPQIDRMKRIR
jgi:hypothetical protein